MSLYLGYNKKDFEVFFAFYCATICICARNRIPYSTTAEFSLAGYFEASRGSTIDSRCSMHAVVRLVHNEYSATILERLKFPRRVVFVLRCLRETAPAFRAKDLRPVHNSTRVHGPCSRVVCVPGFTACSRANIIMKGYGTFPSNTSSQTWSLVMGHFNDPTLY